MATGILPGSRQESRNIFPAGNPTVISARLKSRRGFKRESRRDFFSRREPRREFFCQQDPGRIPARVIFLFHNPGESLLPSSFQRESRRDLGKIEISSEFQRESRRDFFSRREPRRDFFFRRFPAGSWRE